MSRSFRVLSEQDTNAIHRNETERLQHRQQSRINAETRIAKQLQALDDAISWSEALRASKELLDGVPYDADLDTIHLEDLQDLSEPQGGPQI